jgi:DNA-binding GntR family transcriptional regulator
MSEFMPNRTRTAYDTIKRRIIELKLGPGAAFTEGELAAVLKFSKTPVREALVRLRQEGLVEAVARSGYRVAPVTVKHARDLFQLRSLLEVEAAGSAAARASDLVGLSTLEKLAAKTYRLSDRAEVRRFLRDNTEFHVGLARLGGNDMLAAMLHQVLEQLERLYHVGLRLDEGTDGLEHEHKALLSAVKAGDVERARKVAAEQAASSRLFVLNALLASDAIVNANIGSAAGD